MWRVSLLLVLILCQAKIIVAQSTIDTASIKLKLERILERDQKTRSSGDSSAYMAYIDSCNLQELEALVSQYGWPGKSLVGPRGSLSAFLVIQHADLKTQEKYFPLLKKAVEAGELKASHFALLEDRILMYNGKKQIYGSQIVIDPQSGAQSFHPIENEREVNSRRAQVGLGPLEEYAKLFGIEYVPAVDTLNHH